MHHQSDECSQAGDEASVIKPLTADEARLWREKHPQVSAWRVVFMQAVVAVVLIVLVWLLLGSQVAASVAWGAFAVVASSAVLARGVSRQFKHPTAMLASLFGWEIVKLALCVALLMLTPKVLASPNWLAVLAGLVLMLKTYWMAFLLYRRRVVTKID